MKKEFIILCGCFALAVSHFCVFIDGAYAKSIDEYLDSAYHLIDQGKYDEALTILKQGYSEHSGQIAFVFAMAEVYHNLQEYETAIVNYLNVLSAIESIGDKAPKELHENLIRAYNSLGQKHHFSEELCLRIIYHTEVFLSGSPELAKDKEYIEFLRKTIGHYNMAKMGAKMMETGGDGKDFNLYNDGIIVDTKIAFKNKAEQRLEEFDLSERASTYQAMPSDKTVDEIFRI
jgi:tetratricopeptide (TPR) repeat protein